MSLVVAQRVRVDSGTSYEMLLELMCVADRRFRSVVTGAPHIEHSLKTAGAGDVLADARTAGRYAWANLLPLAGVGRRARTSEALRDAVAATSAQELHRWMLGGRRRQLLELVGEDILDGVLSGDRTARSALRRTLGSDTTVLEATAWLLSAPSEEVHALVVRALEGWAAARGPVGEATMRQELRGSARRLRSVVADLDPREAIAAAAPGLDYTSERMPAEVVLVSSTAVAPIVVFVDDVRRTVLATAAGMAPRPESTEHDRLVAGTRAVGDVVRVRVLDVLRDGPAAARELSEALGQPRTSLLHHLALLRSAGLVTTAVGPDERTVYRLDGSAVDALASTLRRRYGTKE